MRAAALLVLLVSWDAHAGTRPVYGGTATIAVGSAAVHLDPARARSPPERLHAALVHQPPLSRDASGQLVPVLLRSVPQPEDGGRTFRLLLRAGLHFHDGSALTPADLAASLRRLGDASMPAAAATLVLPVRSIDVDGEAVVVRLAFAYPAWAQVLAEPAAAVVPASAPQGVPLPGAGPFRLLAREREGGMRLAAFEGHALGRPFLDQIRIVNLPSAAGALAAGRVDLALGAGSAVAPLAPTDAILALSPAAGALDGLLESSLDRTDLVRWFAPGGAAPMPGLLPGLAALSHRTAAVPAGVRTLLYDPAGPGQLALAERLQLRLHERGVEVRLSPEPAATMAARMAQGFELALLEVAVPSDPGMAAAAPLLAAGDAASARALLERAGAAGLDPAAELAAVQQAAAAVSGARIVPLFRTRAALGAASPPSLMGLPCTSPADMARVFREAR